MGTAAAGGSAAAGGFDYQDRCAAWFLVHLLAGAAAASPPDVWTGSLSRIDCETGQPVDDVCATSEAGIRVAAQMKHVIELRTARGSEFAKTVRQFIGHHRSPGHEHDRLVLCTTSKTGAPIRVALRQVLQRIRESHQGTDVVSSARNKEERAALTTLIAHIEQEWRDTAGELPASAQVRLLLEHCYVMVLDVDPGGRDEAGARTLLRALVEPAEAADATWDVLIGRASRLAADRSGTDAGRLRDFLTSRGIALATSVDLARDVARLTALSQRELSLLAEALVTIPGPAGPIRIDRDAVRDIAARGLAGPLLLVGDPGVGKTVALRELALALDAAGTRSLFLPIGSFTASSLGELRVELGLDHDILEVLAGWSPGKPKVLIVDAYDAARVDGRAGLWQTVIEAVSARPDWHAVASVRTWDLEHSARLASIFPDAAMPMTDFTDAELEVAAADWPELSGLIAEAPKYLRTLLGNPFNLRLAAGLLLEGTKRAELARITSRVELLDKYWDARVADNPQGIARDQLARRTAREALAAKTLSVPTAAALGRNSAAEPLLHQLLSRAVLVDASTTRSAAPSAVRFAHHVFFDHAVSLTFADAPDSLPRALDGDPNIALFARPSVELYLQRLWLQNRGAFWTTVLALFPGGPGTRLVTITALQVAARSSNEISDLAGLLDPITSGMATDAQYQALRYLALAVSLDREDSPNAPPGVWPAVAELISVAGADAELPLRVLLGSLITTKAPLTGRALLDAGAAARRWLAMLWSGAPNPATRFAIDAVVKTAASDPPGTERLLRQALEPTRLVTHGADDLPYLCDGVSMLAPLMGAFVADLYRGVMLYEEESTDPILMYRSRILPLSSNRRQDVEQAQWTLAEHYPDFLAHAFAEAVDALADIIDPDQDGSDEIRGKLGSRHVSVLNDPIAWRYDNSYSSGDGDPTALLRHFEDHLATLTDSMSVGEHLDAIAARARPTAVWHRVMGAASRSALVANELGPLSTVIALWGTSQLNPAIAHLVKTRLTELDHAERAAVVAAVAALDPGPDEDTPERYSAVSRFRRLLRSLGPDKVASQAADEAQADEPDEYVALVRDVSYADGDVDRGYAGPDRDALALIAEVERLGNSHRDVPADGAVVDAHVDAVRAVVALDASLLSPAVTQRVQTTVTHAARIWCEQGPDHNSASMELARAVLIAHAADREPTADAEPDEPDLLVIWDGPRTDAARGLTALARFGQYATAAMWAAIRQLAADPLPAVRLLVVEGAIHLSKTNPALMWEILTTRAGSDSNGDVLKAVVRIAWWLHKVSSQAFGLVAAICSREIPDEGRNSPTAECATVAGLIWTLEGNSEARPLLDDLCARATPRALGHMLHEIRQGDCFTSDDDAVRARTLALCDQLINQGRRAIAGWERWSAATTEANTARIREGLELLEVVASQLAFASGYQKARQDKNREPLLAELRLADEAAPLLENLAGVPLARMVHHVIQSIAFVLDANPARALRLVHAFVTAGGEAGGYQFEALGAAEVVQIVQRLLADHRAVLRDESALDQIRELLEIFVDAGWPAAQRLAFSIDQILR